MRAVLIKNPGPDSSLEIGKYETPRPAENEVLVRVHATALNRADLLQRSGNYPPPQGASPLLGLEMAGTVESWGSRCSGWKKGDRVFGLLPGGGYAEYVVIPQDLLLRIPDPLTFEQAAAIPEVFLTAYQALFWLGELKARDRVLVHAGASGVGTATIQLARLAEADVYVTASSSKHALCKELGALEAIDYKNEDFVERIQGITNGRGVHVLIDFIGAPYLQKNIEALGLDGRLVMLGLMGGVRVESFHLGKLFRKRIHVKASTLRNRSELYKIDLTQAVASFCLTHFESGALKPVVDSVYNWHEVEEAHRRMAGNHNAGKIVLRID